MPTFRYLFGASLIACLLTTVSCQQPAQVNQKAQLSEKRWREQSFSSRALQKEAKLRVMLPVGYDETSQTAYPVLYLLHGYSGDYTNWFDLVPIMADLSDARGMLIVTPDGGYGSWYVDSPLRDSGQYETFFVEELIPFIDSLLPTQTNREGRGIAGLSMGGHGAFLLAARHPELFGAAGSMSGAFDLENMWEAGYDLEAILGDHEQGRAFWTLHTTYSLIDSFAVHNTAITLDCGMADELWPHSLRMHELLLAKSIAHTFRALPGKHDWPYWRRAIPGQLAFFRLFFERPASQ